MSKQTKIYDRNMESDYIRLLRLFIESLLAKEQERLLAQSKIIPQAKASHSTVAITQVSAPNLKAQALTQMLKREKPVSFAAFCQFVAKQIAAHPNTEVSFAWLRLLLKAVVHRFAVKGTQFELSSMSQRALWLRSDIQDFVGNNTLDSNTGAALLNFQGALESFYANVKEPDIGIRLHTRLAANQPVMLDICHYLQEGGSHSISIGFQNGFLMIANNGIGATQDNTVNLYRIPQGVHITPADLFRLANQGNIHSSREAVNQLLEQMGIPLTEPTLTLGSPLLESNTCGYANARLLLRTSLAVADGGEDIAAIKQSFYEGQTHQIMQRFEQQTDTKAASALESAIARIQQSASSDQASKLLDNIRGVYKHLQTHRGARFQRASALQA